MNTLKSYKGVYISTYGCQMNVNDTDRMYAILEMQNYMRVPDPSMADLIVINSCSIREKPVHKVHSEVGRYKHLKKQNKNLRIAVGGCVGQQEKKKLLKDLQIVDFVFGPDNIDELPEILLQKERACHARLYPHKPYEIQTLINNPGISTFVNITKGCDNFCTFCVVPFTRGRLRSRPASDIINDINSLIQRGVLEVTLLGQNVNSYHWDLGVNFADLLRQICQQTAIQRVRYTTSHPKDFDYDLVKVMAQYRPRICDYIHLPVQSGNSQILKRMNRGYTREEYLKKVKMILDHLPGVALSTDLIVGFPGETKSQFQETLTLLDEVPFESIFAFKYSPRPFTKAAKYEDQVSEDEKSERLKILFEKHNKIAYQLVERYENTLEDVLVESFEKKSGIVSGRTTQNKIVHFKGDKSFIGQTIRVKIHKAHPQTFRGEKVA